MDDFDFTITFYYWGKIRNNPYRYEGGEIKIYEDNNSNEMSLAEIWNKAKIFGCDENDVFMYRVPTMPFAGGLKPLENDLDVMNMVKCIRALALENCNATLFYNSKNHFIIYTILFYNTSTSQTSIFIKILFF